MGLLGKLVSATKHSIFQGGTKHHVMRAHLAAYELLAMLKTSHEGRRVRLLDIGGAHGIHARFFREVGIHVDVIDLVEGDEPAIFVGDYFDFAPHEPYDVIWTSHVLEHIRNTGLFLDKIYSDLASDGLAAMTVPPIREGRMAFNHYSLWNPGILLLQMSLAGFDPETAHVAKYRYNVSAIMAKRRGGPANPKASFSDDIRVSDLHFKGDFKRMNWTVGREADLPTIGEPFSTVEDAERAMRSQAGMKFCYVEQDEKRKLYYLDGKRLIPSR